MKLNILLNILFYITGKCSVPQANWWWNKWLGQQKPLHTISIIYIQYTKFFYLKKYFFANPWFPQCPLGWQQSQTARSWASAATDQRRGSWCWSHGRWLEETPGRAGLPPFQNPHPAHTGPGAGTHPLGSVETGNTNKQIIHLHFY